MASHLIYHPKRTRGVFSGTTVYYDSPQGNQDPYVWNDPFLHTYCHMSELTRPEIGDIQFWVSGNTFPNFSALYCDLVFAVGSKAHWSDSNQIASTDQIVDSLRAYEEHYRWHHQHPYKRRHRFTLKACSKTSFQPQTAQHNLFDILPWLNANGYATPTLQQQLQKGRGSKPLVLPLKTAEALHQHIAASAEIKLDGSRLMRVRANISSLEN